MAKFFRLKQLLFATRLKGLDLLVTFFFLTIVMASLIIISFTSDTSKNVDFVLPVTKVVVSCTPNDDITNNDSEIGEKIIESALLTEYVRNTQYLNTQSANVFIAVSIHTYRNY